MSNEYKLLNQITPLEDISPTNVNMDNEKSDRLRAKQNVDSLANASMTESYSEILHSPTADANGGPSVESNTPIVIAKRKPTPLNRHHSSQSKFYVFFFNRTFISIYSIRNFQHHFRMVRFEWMKAT